MLIENTRKVKMSIERIRDRLLAGDRLLGSSDRVVRRDEEGGFEGWRMDARGGCSESQLLPIRITTQPLKELQSKPHVQPPAL